MIGITDATDRSELGAPQSTSTTLRSIFDRVVSRDRAILGIGRGIGFIILVLLFLFLTLDGTSFAQTTVQSIAVNASLGLAVVLLLGYAGELSFAYGAIFGSAGYCAYELMVHGVPVWLSIALGFVASMLVGGLVALPALRIRHLQLALATFGAGIAAVEIFSHISGDAGIVELPTVTIAGHPLGILDPGASALVALVILSVTFLFAEFVVGGRIGRRWLLMKSDEGTARSFGARVPRERILAFMLSSACVGLIGAMYPTLMGLLSPTPYGFQTVIDVLIVAFIGGLFTPGGALLGAVIFQGVSQGVSSASPGVSQIVYGVLLLGILWLLPRGVIGAVDSAQRRVREQITRWRFTADRGAEDAATAVGSVDGPPPNLPVPASGAVASGSSGAGLTLEATGMTIHFGAFCAVDEVGITIRSGEVTGIIGANGAGKSTLLDLLTGFRKSEGGRIELLGGGGATSIGSRSAARAPISALSAPSSMPALSQSSRWRTTSEWPRRWRSDLGRRFVEPCRPYPSCSIWRRSGPTARFSRGIFRLGSPSGRRLPRDRHTTSGRVPR